MKTLIASFLIVTAIFIAGHVNSQTVSKKITKHNQGNTAVKKAQVTITSDKSCVLFVNGTKKMIVSPDAAQVLRLSPGQYIIKAVDTINAVAIMKNVKAKGLSMNIFFDFQGEIAKKELLQKQHQIDSLKIKYLNSISSSGNTRESKNLLHELYKLDNRLVSVCNACHGDGMTIQSEICPNCNGQGHSTCRICNGQGSETCNECNGRGKTECSRCHGTGSVECVGCSGSGKCGSCYGTGHSGSITCFLCGGSGNCIYCHGNGKNKCNGAFIHSDCNNTGSVLCTQCDGKGKKRCHYCNGTGDKECNSCQGKGKKETSTKCNTCNGLGMIMNP
jgi:hypothetical protein